MITRQHKPRAALGALLPAAIAAATLSPTLAKGDTETVDGIEWRYYVRNGEAVVAYSPNSQWSAAVPYDTSGDIVVPSELGGYPVTQIGYCAFVDRYSITSVVFPESVRNVGDYAFYGCNSITNVFLPAAVTSIGSCAFAYCQELSEVNLPELLKSIQGEAFGWSALNSVEIPSSVVAIGANPFVGCSDLNAVSVDAGNQRYKAVDGVLFDKSGWTLIAYPAGLSATSYAIPQGVSEIGSYAFSDCRNLASVSLPSGLQLIGGGAFENCDSLESISLPEGLSSINWSAFYGCSSLPSIHIPASVSYIDGNAFSGCSGLTVITVDPANYSFEVRDGALFEISSDTLMVFPGGSGAVDYAVPSGTKRIGSSAFYNNPTIETVETPESLQYVGSQAFANCQNLREVELRGSVTSMDNYAFAWNSSLTNVTIASGTTVLGSYMFESCYNLKTVRIPSTVSEIEYRPFSGCNSLEKIYLGGNSPVTEEELRNAGVPTTCEIVRTPAPVLGAESFNPVPATELVPYEAKFPVSSGTEPYTWQVADSGLAIISSEDSSFAEVGEAQGWSGYWGAWDLNLPFEFPFFGNTYSSVRVGGNGFLDFGMGWTDYWGDNADRTCINVLATYLYKTDIFVESASDHVTVRWSGWYDGSPDAPVNFSVTLYPNGRIVMSYGDGNGSARSKNIGLYAGDGATTLTPQYEQYGSMDNAADIVFEPLALPEGLSLAADGTLSGTVEEPGEYKFGVKVTDANGEAAEGVVSFVVEENPAVRPAISSMSPVGEYVNMAGKNTQYFQVSASHPAGGTLAYAWSLDGEPVGKNQRIYPYRPEDDGYHVVKVSVSGTDLPKTAERIWKTGVLSITDPESTTVSHGMNASLSVGYTASLPAKLTWRDAETDEEVGSGTELALREISETASYYAVAENAFGAVTSAVATVTCDPAPFVGRVYKMTGPAFVGNRLVLRAKPYGDLSEATFSWTRDGVEVSTDERLDISALTSADFGSYVLSVTSPHGTASSESFALVPAPAGVPLGWGASDHGRTTTPEGLTGVAQIASGMNFNLALATNGTVTAWGYNGHGGCDVPAGLSDVSFVAAGGYESQGAGFAVKTDGTVIGWGTPLEINGYWSWRRVDEYDDDGNWIGGHEEQYWYTYTNGWDTVSTMPSDLSDVVQVAVGGDLAVALKADGSVVSWGRETGWWEQEYDEETDSWNDVWVREELYAPLLEATDIVQVAVGGQFAIALKADGTLVAWGNDDNNYWYHYLGVPSGLTDQIAVATTKDMWAGSAGFALGADGTISAWGDGFNNYDLRYPPQTADGFAAIDGGQEYGVALASDGTVALWGNTWGYDLVDVPAPVQEGALGIAAGGYHVTAILPDSDGDTIADADEALIGRDPNKWEDWHRASVTGTTTVGGNVPEHSPALALYDAAGDIRGYVRANPSDGSYVFEDVVPGRYFLKISAQGAKDFWLGDAEPGTGASAPFSTFNADSRTFDFDLEPVQADAWASVEPRRSGTDETDDEDGGDPRVALAGGMTIYLDMWPAETTDGNLVLLGEVAASHGEFDETTLLPHSVTVKDSASGAQVPAPDVWVDGEEGATVVATPYFSAKSGAVRVVTDPAGAEVWIDYADKSLGTTPLVVDNLAAGASHSHVLLLRKSGYLRPRPIEFAIAEDEATVVSVPLEDEASPAMSVAVSSAVPGMPIYLDYLPTELVTPATVGGMDPASHAGDLWFSASHSILLRHLNLTPFAPRAVPEWNVDPVTQLPEVPLATPVLEIFAPNTYEWEWGEVTITAEDKPDISGSGALTFGSDPLTGSPTFEIVVANPVPGAFYTAFACDELGEPFTAAAASVQAAGTDEELRFLLDATPASKFARIVVSARPFDQGDELPDDVETP